ncbi:hypothetical protein LAT59_01305, partial [Candidatus Gracilibacteria bacterium]|nr:hypothetical protein [Candidatus Gracilibacteria bacterium]
ITTDNPVGSVSGTQASMRIVSESTGSLVTRTGGVVSSREHLLTRSKPTITRHSETTSTTAFKFSITADQNRRLDLDALAFNVRGIIGDGITFDFRRDGSNEIIASTTDVTLAIGGTDVILTGFQDGFQIAAGSTITYILEISGVDTSESGNRDRTREVRLTNLLYRDDVSTPSVIEVAPYNILPTTPSTYRY